MAPHGLLRFEKVLAMVTAPAGTLSVASIIKAKTKTVQREELLAKRKTTDGLARPGTGTVWADTVTTSTHAAMSMLGSFNPRSSTDDQANPDAEANPFFHAAPRHCTLLRPAESKARPTEQSILNLVSFSLLFSVSCLVVPDGSWLVSVSGMVLPRSHHQPACPRA